MVELGPLKYVTISDTRHWRRPRPSNFVLALRGQLLVPSLDGVLGLSPWTWRTYADTVFLAHPLFFRLPEPAYQAAPRFESGDRDTCPSGKYPARAWHYWIKMSSNFSSPSPFLLLSFLYWAPRIRVVKVRMTSSSDISSNLGLKLDQIPSSPHMREQSQFTGEVVVIRECSLRFSPWDCSEATRLSKNPGKSRLAVDLV